MSTWHPYFRRPRRTPGKPSGAFMSCGDHVDLSGVHLPAYPDGDAVPRSQASFDARAAAAIRAAVGIDGGDGNGPVRIWPAVIWEQQPFDTGDGTAGVAMVPKEPWFLGRDLLEMKWYAGQAPTIYLPTAKCLPALAYADFFPDRPGIGLGLRSMVSAAVLAASPGWCGTFGPGVDGTFDLIGGPSEGNYDMTEMHLVSMAYQFFDALSPEARERLITLLLARGRIHRPNRDDTFTSGLVPNDWARAGYISPLGAHKDLGETENHILMIATARYLTNQLLYQRDGRIEHDNRRNGVEGGPVDWPSSTSLLLSLLRNILRGDFSEYNAKSYQEETRWALLNLCSYAYDHEVRLAARMVLDYLSAHMAVSSNDLRRLLPFRRRNEGDYVAHDADGFMTVGLVEGQLKPDPMTAYFAMQAGNVRAYRDSRPWGWSIPGDGTRLALEVLSAYRIPPSILDLFVNDAHRRYFQRLHRTPRDEEGGNRNADNMEIFAGSPSYLITAGGEPSGYAIDPYFAGFVFGDQDQQLGVAVPTSFMPTGLGVNATELIQFGGFAAGSPFVGNYGVAPDFACGHKMHLPPWVLSRADRIGRFLFVNLGGDRPGTGPGFYLAILRTDGPGLLEALDTWLHPDVTYEGFVAGVLARNGSLDLVDDRDFEYTTANGNHIVGKVWEKDPVVDWPSFGAVVHRIEFGGGDPTDSIGDARDVTDRLLSGTIMTSPGEAVVEIQNPALDRRVILDMSDPWHPRRTDEQGEVEQAGFGNEVWVDFDWVGPSEGDAFRPFARLGEAWNAMADGGEIRIVPSTSTDRSPIGARKRGRVCAPVGGVILGASDPAERGPISGTGDPMDPVRKNDVWVQFDFPASARGNVPGPLKSLAEAELAVTDGDVIRIVPGVTTDRLTIGSDKRFTLVAPLGGVVIGGHATPGPPEEVWVDLDWPGIGDGRACTPFKTIGIAMAAVASDGTIRIMPGSTRDRSTIGGKRVRLVASSDRVTIGIP
jgi:hypothetical protein